MMVFVDAIRGNDPITQSDIKLLQPTGIKGEFAFPVAILTDYICAMQPVAKPLETRHGNAD